MKKLLQDFHWFDESLTDKTTMSFDVVPLDLMTDTIEPKITTEPEPEKDKQQLDVRINSLTTRILVPSGAQRVADRVCFYL